MLEDSSGWGRGYVSSATAAMAAEAAVEQTENGKGHFKAERSNSWNTQKKIFLQPLRTIEF